MQQAASPVKTSGSAELFRLAGKILVQNVRAVVGGGSRSIPRGDTRFVPPPRSVRETELAAARGDADANLTVDPSHSQVSNGDASYGANAEPHALLPWLGKMLAAPVASDDENKRQHPPPVPETRRSGALLEELSTFLDRRQISDDPRLRLRRAHGQTGLELWAARYGELDRVPDLVVFPETEAQAAQLTRAAAKHQACLVPFGGGTSVTYALRLSRTEQRFVIAVDMRLMNRIRWIDPVNLLACIEAGATGQYIASELGKYKLTLGLEPYGAGLSTLGGWIAANAGNLKQNRYGRIADLVLDVQVVTAHGILGGPEITLGETAGMNPKSLIFGSEGSCGIITSAVVKLCKAPEQQRHASAFFSTLGTGLDFLYDLQRSGAVPPSAQLLDSTQFKLTQALAPRIDSSRAGLKSRVENVVVTQLKGFEPRQLALAAVVFEGTAEEVAFQEKAFHRITKAHGGINGGASHAKRGYESTLAAAAIRSHMASHWVMTNSIDATVTWTHALNLYERLRERVRREHEARRLPGNPYFSGRVTQVHSSGVGIHFCLGFYCKGVADPLRQCAELERAVREEVLLTGGALSHDRSGDGAAPVSLKDVHSQGSSELTRRVKAALDPETLFGASSFGANTSGTNNHGTNGVVPLRADPR